jgi:ANTAR domain-containing protein/PAS domain-containing protein
MTGAKPGNSPVERARAGDAFQRVGWYRFYFDDERWEWSPEVEAIHGYRPGTANPTTDVVLSHKHPEDRAFVAAILADIRRTHNPFSTRHRIIAVQGECREVVVIAERLHDNTGAVVGTQGFYLDVTPVGPTQLAAMDAAVAEFAENRAVIEQVKGVLMFVYRIDAGAAFDLLKWRSQETNTKLRAFAEQLQDDFRAMNYADRLPPRPAFDRLLVTAHQRVRARNARRAPTPPPAH